MGGVSMQIVEEQVDERMLEALQHRIRVLCPAGREPKRIRTEQDAYAELARSGTEPVGFLQVFNTWR